MKLDGSEIILIQGLFFVEDMTPTIGYKPDIGEAVKLIETVNHYIFAGVIKYIDNEDVLIGGLKDHFGKSTIFDIELLDDKLRFTKRYENRNDLIYYRLSKQGSVWVGEYSGENVATNLAWCILTPVSKGLYDYNKMKELLNQK